MFGLFLLLLINNYCVEAMNEQKESTGKSGWIIVSLILATLVFFYYKQKLEEEEENGVVKMQNSAIVENGGKNSSVAASGEINTLKCSNDDRDELEKEARELISFVTEKLVGEPSSPLCADVLLQSDENEGEIEIDYVVATESDLNETMDLSFEQLLHQNMTVTECFEVLCQRESRNNDFGDDIQNLQLLFSENIRLKSFCKSVAYGDHVVTFEKKDYSVHIVAKKDFSGIKCVVFEADGQFKTYHHIEETNQKTRYALSAVASAINEACSDQLLIEIKNPGGYDGLTIKILGNSDVIYAFNGNEFRIDNGLVYFDNGNTLPNLSKKANEVISLEMIRDTFEPIVEQLRNLKMVKMPKLQTTFIPSQED